jgi:multidrug transporter EmrE-like cation transporter
VSAISGVLAPTVDVAPVAAASGAFTYTWLLIALPAIGAVILLLGGKRTNAWGHWLGVLASAASFLVGVWLFIAMLGQPDDSRGATQHLFDWIDVGSFHVPFTLRLDQLSMVFVLLITGVGTLIHVYSVGYMSHDRDRRRFFAYLNLFVAAMLLLVLADNYLLLYVGWEGVGLASYLLIGFWFFKETAAVPRRRRPSSPTASATSASPSPSCSCSSRSGRSPSRACSATPAAPASRGSPGSAWPCSSRPAASRHSSRCRPGCSTRWRARPRCRRSSTRPRWSPPASTSSCARARSSTTRRPRATR